MLREVEECAKGGGRVCQGRWKSVLREVEVCAKGGGSVC